MFEQKPALRFLSLDSDKAGPQQARLATIKWTAAATGGSGDLTYKFVTRSGFALTVQQEGPSPEWDWSPQRPGTYRVKVVATDSSGDSVESGWSPEFVIQASIQQDALIAILPVENLSGAKAPLDEIVQALANDIQQIGFRLLDKETLEKFMKKHRVRYTGGVSSDISEAMLKETGAQAILITSLEGFKDGDPPKIALFSRLVTTGPTPTILWINGVGLTGDQSPGLLGLGLIHSLPTLLNMATGQLTDSLDVALFAGQQGEAGSSSPNEVSQSAEAFYKKSFREAGYDYDPYHYKKKGRLKKKFMPPMFFRSPIFNPEQRSSLVIVPFLNESTRKNAGEIMALHFLDQLFWQGNFQIIEPGLLREEFLKHRTIMRAGPSLAVTDLLTSEDSLGVDLVLSGKVFDYQDKIGTPKVDFSVQMIEKQSREIVFNTNSYTSGDEGVFFFDVGRVRSAHRLANGMTETLVQLLEQ